MSTTSKFKEIISTIKSLLNTKFRIIVAISGICGSGKSFIAAELYKLLSPSINTILSPMDGYHRKLADLSDEEIQRRGAHWTFDGNLFAEKITQLISSQASDSSADNQIIGGNHIKDVFVNGWDHSLKDPQTDSIKVSHDVRVVLVEGLHLFLDFEPWCSIREHYDIKIWINSDLEVSMKRLIKRHIETGLSKNEEEARIRVNRNDRLNAEFLMENAHLEPDFTLSN